MLFGQTLTKKLHDRFYAPPMDDHYVAVLFMTQAPAVSRRSFLHTGLCSLTIPAACNIGLFGVAACQAETNEERQSASPSDWADHQLLQSKLDKRGTVVLDRSYYVSDTLYVSGNTQIKGIGAAKIVWTGPSNRSIIKDTSSLDPSITNSNILLENFEIDGGDLVTGSADQLAIEFYRTGNVVLRQLIVHGVGGSGIRWGNSYVDTTDIIVENCTIFDCRSGDALQGSGRRILLQNNMIGTPYSRSSFGDTGVALIMDFERRTNPESLFSNDVRISNNKIVGNYGENIFKGIGGKSQTGIACGPFDTSSSSSILIEGNSITGCYVSIWLIAMKDVSISNNMIGKHHSSLTGNLRLDNISNAIIKNNKIYVKYPSKNDSSSAILINSRRSVYGNSMFDGDVKLLNITNNKIYGSGSCGIRMEFGESNTNPIHISRINDVIIQNNNFIGVKYPIFLAPVTGENPRTFNGMSVEGNVSDIQTAEFITMLGRKAQYSGIIIKRNIIPDKAALMSGTGTRIE